MNQRPQGLKVQKAMTGFLQYKSAEGLAPVSATGYEPDISQIQFERIIRGD